jgi:hypothetical protein
MISLFRLLLAAIVVWSVCRFFYKLGQKGISRPNRPATDNKRKKVESSVVDKEPSDRAGSTCAK